MEEIRWNANANESEAARHSDSRKKGWDSKEKQSYDRVVVAEGTSDVVGELAVGERVDVVRVVVLDE